jgi:hypothetical protein
MSEMGTEIKACTLCKFVKPVSDFGRASTKKAGYRSRCKDCERGYNFQYNRRPEVVERRRGFDATRDRYQAPSDTRRSRLWTHFKMTPEQYEARLEAQVGRCAICRTDAPGGTGSFHIDHDHDCCPGKRSCGKCVRGLLCARCNLMLGYSRDNELTLRRAAAYLAGV